MAFSSTRVQKVMIQPINLIFRYLQSRARVSIWLFENVNERIEGQIIGFDEYMNLVLDEAEEVHIKTGNRVTLGRILLKGDSVTLIQNISEVGKMMEIRRSKRIFAKIKNVTEDTIESSVQKKKKSDVSSEKKSNFSKFTKKKSCYFNSKINPEITECVERTTNKKLKSSYFKSPVISEDSAESEYEPESPVCGKIKKNRNSTSKYQKNQSKKPNSDSSSEEFVASQSFKKIRESFNNNTNSQKLSENYGSQKLKNSYESESDSSSDDFVETPKSSFKPVETDSCECNIVSQNCDLEKENENLTTENNPVEYFDFTSLLSQVTESNDQIIKNVENETNTIDEKKRIYKDNMIAEKKTKRSKKLSVNTKNDEYEIPKQVEVLLNAPTIAKKRKCNDLEMALRRRLNNIKRENQVYIHKVHVLCWIAHGNYVNFILNSADVLCVALSLLPSEKCYPSKFMNLKYLEDLMDWFNKKVKLKKSISTEHKVDLLQKLLTQFQKLEAESKTDLCFMFISFVRALGIQCRLVINLNVIPIKPTSDQLLPVTQTKIENEQKSCTKKSKTISNKSCANTCTSTSSKKKLKEQNQTPPKVKKNEKHDVKKISKNDVKKVKDIGKISKSASKSSKKKKQSTYFKDTAQGSRRSRRTVHMNSKYFDEDSTSDEKSKFFTKKSLTSKTNSLTKQVITKKVKYETPVEEKSTSDDSDDGFEEVTNSPKNKKKIDRRVLSSSSDEENKDIKPDVKAIRDNKNNYWIEIFLEAEEKWFCVDINKKSYHCMKQLYNNASHPVRYILAWNNDQSIKDVTRRYVPQYLTVTRKLRIDENWWKNTMEPFKPSNTAQNREEDEELEKMLEEQPIPSSIQEYKSHPLYVLKRHLLKFQAIYPPDAPPLGFIKGEPVYSRLCVHQLHGREMWIKEAKVVKLNEKPYKIVKGRPQRNKFGISEPPKDLELFGLWQVEDYVPPKAENGKVPRNAFGNVELFKPSMLPKGTVYLQLPGLQKIANKLSIDCAQAIVGFEYSTNGWSYPVKDGFVVCEEFKDILLDAYNQEIEEAEKKEKQKREDRIYTNWKRLIKGLFIREKLKRKYNFGDPGTSLSDTNFEKESKMS
ncbi:hypothetical protein PGB90_010273 [Kerria lacca]